MGTQFIKCFSQDPYFANVVLYLKGNGINGSTTFVDSSFYNRPISAFGNTQIDTAISREGGSIRFDGNGDYLVVPQSSDFVFGDKDYTVESWFYTTTAQTYLRTGRICGTYDYDSETSLNKGWVLGVNRSSPLYSIGFSNESTFLSNSGTLPINTWIHLAASYHEGVLRLFVQGSVVASAAITVSNTFLAPLVIGSGNDRGKVIPFGSGIDLNGNLDLLRITKGVGRYVNNFNPLTDTYYV